MSASQSRVAVGKKKETPAPAKKVEVKKVEPIKPAASSKKKPEIKVGDPLKDYEEEEEEEDDDYYM